MGAVIVLEDGTTIVPYNSSRTGPQMDAAMDGGDSVGDISQLTTTNKSSIVGAINEVNSENAEDLKELLDWNTTPWGEGFQGTLKSKFRIGRIDPTTGEESYSEVKRAISRDFVEISELTNVLIYITGGYSTYKLGIACYKSSGEHLGNVGYFTNDVGISSLSSGTEKIKFMMARVDSDDISASDLIALHNLVKISYGNFLVDNSLHAYYSTQVGGGNTFDKYAFLGFSTANKSSVVLNPTGKINSIGIILKDRRYVSNLSECSLDTTLCGNNDNKLIFYNPLTKVFKVIDGLDTAPYRKSIKDYLFIGFVCIPQPEISKTILQMSVDSENINPYFDEYNSRLDEYNSRLLNIENSNNQNILFQYSLLQGDDVWGNAFNQIPLLNFTSLNKSHVEFSDRLRRFIICVNGVSYGYNVSELVLDTTGIGNGDNKLVYFNTLSKTVYVFDGTNPSSQPSKTNGNVFLALVCVPAPEVSVCKMQMSVDGKCLMMSNVSMMETEKYSGKTLSVIGDSISRYDSSRGGEPSGTSGWGGDQYKNIGYAEKDMWWSKVAHATGMIINTINANAGSTCSTANPNRIEGSSDYRTSRLSNGNEPDFIICEMGTNDFLYGAEIGTFDGTTALGSDTSKFKIAYANMLKKIQMNYPNAKVLCATIHQNVFTDYKTVTQNLQTIVNKNGITLATYNNAIRDIAKLFGAEIIDFETCGLTLANCADYTTDTTANMHLHPNKKGQTMLADEAIKHFK